MISKGLPSALRSTLKSSIDSGEWTKSQHYMASRVRAADAGKAGNVEGGQILRKESKAALEARMPKRPTPDTNQLIRRNRLRLHREGKDVRPKGLGKIPKQAFTQGKGKVRVTGYEGDGRFSAITNRDEKIVRSRDAYKFQKRATIERRETWLGPGERWDIKDEQGKKVGDTGTYPKRFGMKSHYGHEDNGLKRWDHGGVGDTTVKPKYRGKGYSTDARIARTQESKHKKIYSSINTTNIASIKSAEKAGGKPIRTHTRKDGVNRVVYVHKKTVSKGLPSAVKAAKADKLLQPMLGRADAKDANHYRYLLHRSQANSKGREYGKDLARGNSDGKQYYLGPGKAARTKSRTALEDAKNAFGVADTRSKQ